MLIVRHPEPVHVDQRLDRLREGVHTADLDRAARARLSAAGHDGHVGHATLEYVLRVGHRRVLNLCRRDQLRAVADLLLPNGGGRAGDDDLLEGHGTPRQREVERGDLPFRDRHGLLSSSVPEKARPHAIRAGRQVEEGVVPVLVGDRAESRSPDRHLGAAQGTLRLLRLHGSFDAPGLLREQRAPSGDEEQQNPPRRGGHLDATAHKASSAGFRQLEARVAGSQNRRRTEGREAATSG